MGKIIFAKDKISANKLSKEAKIGKLKRVYHGIYTDDLDAFDAKIIQKNWMIIISYWFQEEY